MYALYKGDKLLTQGTIFQIAKEMNIKVHTAQYYGTPSYIKRSEDKGEHKFRRLVKI